MLKTENMSNSCVVFESFLFWKINRFGDIVQSYISINAFSATDS